VAQIADRSEAGHARAALQRVQIALQAADQLAILRRGAQVRHQRVGVIENVGAFLDEDFEQVLVHLGEFETAVRLRVVG